MALAGNDSRETALVKALRLIQMFNAGTVTNEAIRDEFGVTRQTAWRWIVAASTVLPIYEERERGLGDRDTHIAYKLLKSEEL